MKLHWCCGDIYLSGYINIDVMGILASLAPNMVGATTLDHYYTRPFSQDFNKRERGWFIVDHIADILKPWQFPDGSVDEVVMISCWEHFTRAEIQHIKSEIGRVLKVGGRLIVDFPDLKKDFELHFQSDPEYFMELVYCNWKNPYSVHKWGYTPETFAKLWDSRFVVTEKTIVKHDYPMIGMEVVKTHE